MGSRSRSARRSPRDARRAPLKTCPVASKAKTRPPACQLFARLRRSSSAMPSRECGTRKRVRRRPSASTITARCSRAARSTPTMISSLPGRSSAALMVMPPRWLPTHQEQTTDEHELRPLSCADPSAIAAYWTTARSSTATPRSKPRPERSSTSRPRTTPGSGARTRTRTVSSGSTCRSARAWRRSRRPTATRSPRS